MKILIIVPFLLLLFAGTAKAQQIFSAEEFNRKLGKTGTLCDTVYRVRIVSDTLTYLSMGGAFPNQKYTVVIKGNKISLNWPDLKGKPLCVTGVFVLYRDRPQIVISQPEQINAR